MDSLLANKCRESTRSWTARVQFLHSLARRSVYLDLQIRWVSLLSDGDSIFTHVKAYLKFWGLPRKRVWYAGRFLRKLDPNFGICNYFQSISSVCGQNPNGIGEYMFILPAPPNLHPFVRGVQFVRARLRRHSAFYYSAGSCRLERMCRQAIFSPSFYCRSFSALQAPCSVASNS